MHKTFRQRLLQHVSQRFWPLQGMLYCEMFRATCPATISRQVARNISKCNSALSYLGVMLGEGNSPNRCEKLAFLIFPFHFYTLPDGTLPNIVIYRGTIFYTYFFISNITWPLFQYSTGIAKTVKFNCLVSSNLQKDSFFPEILLILWTVKILHIIQRISNVFNDLKQT